MERFGKIVLNIQNLSPDVAMHHMIMALRSGPFNNSLCMEPAANLDELWHIATKFMQLEELREFRNQARVEAGGDNGKDKEKERLSRPAAE